jgi:uncharacterized protein (DUF2062 family)
MLRREAACQHQQAMTNRCCRKYRHTLLRPDPGQMPRRFFRKFAFKRHHLSEQWFMSPFRHLLNDHRLWGIRRRNVVPAFAVGVFIAFMPFPGHTLAGALLALAFRINIPVAALATWISNPVTVFVMYPAAYQLGRTLLDAPDRKVSFALSWEWVTHTFVTIWQPMILGCLIMGTAAAVVGYVTLDWLWRSSIVNYKTRKRKDRKDRQI